MSLRFRRSIKVLPGIRLNVGKRGVSSSIGVRGVHITLGNGKVRETIELPGTGLSYTHVERTHQEGPGEAQPLAVPDVLPKGRAWQGWVWMAALIGLVSFLVHLVWRP